MPSHKFFLCKAHILNYLFADYLNGFKCLLKPFGIYVLVITSRPHFTQNPFNVIQQTSVILQRS
jgi:hypothetical protein